MNNPYFFIPKTGYLYLEKSLVELDIPLLFTCKNDSGQLYLCLCIDSSSYPPTFLVTETTSNLLIKMLSNNIPMDMTFKHSFDQFPENIYQITESDDISSNSVSQLNVATIPEAKLPRKGSYFEIDLDYIQEYIAYLENYVQNKQKILNKVFLRNFTNKSKVIIKNSTFIGLNSPVFTRSIRSSFQEIQLSKEIPYSPVLRFTHIEPSLYRNEDSFSRGISYENQIQFG